MASRNFDPRDVVMQDADRGMDGEHKRPTPPPDSLEQILRGWRSSLESESASSETSQSRRGAGCDRDMDNQEYDDYDAEQDDKSMEDAGAMSSEATTPPSDGGKRSRYLREADRHAIIQRIDSGEKQVELAREYGVTRAAVCHINKNRSEILARSTRPDVHAAARHPKRRMAKTAIAQRQLRRQQRQLEDRVYTTRSLALAVHMTTLRDQSTDSRTFRAAADRALLLLTEEALALVSSAAASASHRSSQTTVESSTCAMIMSDGDFPFLQAYRAVQPESPVGFMTLAYNDQGDVRLTKMSAPLDLREQSIFLLTVACTSALEVSTAIRALLEFGASESSIVLVTLVVAAAVVVDIQDQFPSVSIVSAAVDRDADPGIDNFFERYFNTTTIHQKTSGSTVNL